MWKTPVWRPLVWRTTGVENMTGMGSMNGESQTGTMTACAAQTGMMEADEEQAMNGESQTGTMTACAAQAGMTENEGQASKMTACEKKSQAAMSDKQMGQARKKNLDRPKTVTDQCHAYKVSPRMVDRIRKRNVDRARMVEKTRQSKDEEKLLKRYG